MKAICAMDEHGGIGKNGTLPWARNIQDLRWFKGMTRNKTVVMGRKTYDDPAMPHPLKDRLNVVIGSTTAADYEWDLSTTLFMKKFEPDIIKYFRDPVLIGGASLFNYAIEHRLISNFYINIVPGDYECDTHINLDLLRQHYDTIDSYSQFEYNERVKEKIGINEFIRKEYV